MVLREDRPGDERLVAHFVPSSEPAPVAIALKRILSETLTDYMMPSAFVKQDALPQTPTGKVDRRALPGSGRGLEHRI